jgi:VWFA-related protein
MPLRWLTLLLFLSVPALSSQTPGAAAEGPALRSRPAETVPTAPNLKRMQLDVVVTDASGKPVTGLQPWDFKLLDNDRPSKILSFRAFDPASVKTDPPAEIILLLDMLNLGVQQQGFARNELTRFLQQNNGQLAHPVTLMVLSDKGVEVQPHPSRDGNAVAAVLKTVNPHITAFGPAMGLQGAIERFNRSLRQMQLIAENETRKPGRKLLIWIGTGWPLLDTLNYVPSASDKDKYFQAIVELSGWLREAHMVVSSVAPIDSAAGATLRGAVLYEDFLKPVLNSQQAHSGNLALRVLAAQTGGQNLGPSNDLAEQIAQCVTDADSFYQLTFEPTPTERAAEFHALKLSVNRTGLTIRTNTGYYDQPQTK